MFPPASGKWKKNNTFRWQVLLASLIVTSLACSLFGRAIGNRPSDEPAEQGIIQQVRGQAIIATDVAAVRSGPSVDSSQIAALGEGIAVTLIAMTPDEDWYLVSFPGVGGESVEGWINATFLSLVVSPTATETPVTPEPTHTPGSGDALPSPDLSSIPTSDFIFILPTPTDRPTLVLPPTATATATPGAIITLPIPTDRPTPSATPSDTPTPGTIFTLPTPTDTPPPVASTALVPPSTP